jgi:hypothetical protein
VGQHADRRLAKPGEFVEWQVEFAVVNKEPHAMD